MNARRGGSGEQGFVLIGVIIFVLALTIIGLSLYSLSGYEAQFLRDSYDGEQAWQSAVGGLDRARFALCVPPYSLASVGQNLPSEGVIAATATQLQGGTLNSTGPLDWNYTGDNPVVLSVTAHAGDPAPAGQTRTVEASYVPNLAEIYYHQLMTIASRIRVGRTEPGSPDLHAPTIQLFGDVWDGSGLSTAGWMARLRTPPVPNVIREPVPLPPDSTFIVDHMPLAVPTVDLDSTGMGGPYTYVLQGTAPVPVFFGNPPNNPHYSLLDTHPQGVVVQVDKYAVWLFPRGARFYHGVRIQGSPGSCLVMVGGPNTDMGGDPSAGIWFYGGLRADIPVILVSRGKVIIEHFYNQDGEFDLPSGAQVTSAASSLAIYSGQVSLTGPRLPPSGHWMPLAHGPDVDAAVTQLYAVGGLPGAQELRLIAGSWRVSTP
jgi:hypothetical protein